MAIKLNTGKQEFVLEFDNGKTESIWFNPCDPDLSLRLKDFQKRTEARIKEMEDVALGADGEPEDIEQIELYRQFRQIISEEFDTAFNSNISDKVFKYCAPFADIGNGETYIMQFIEGIKPEIEKRVSQSKEATNKAMERHLAKYRGKK